MTDHTALKEAAEAADSQTTERGKEIDKILWSSARELENIGLRGLSSKLGMDVPSWIKNLQESYLNACQSFDDVSDQNAALLAENEALRERIDELEEAISEIGAFAHNNSTGPAVLDAFWSIRDMAYRPLETREQTDARIKVEVEAEQ